MNRCLSNLCLGAHNALRQGTRSDEEGLGNLLGGQPAHLTQSERYARFGRKRWMTAGKHEAQPNILNLLVIEPRIIDTRLDDARLDAGSKISLCSVEARAPAHRVDGLEASR